MRVRRSTPARRNFASQVSERDPAGESSSGSRERLRRSPIPDGLLMRSGPRGRFCFAVGCMLVELACSQSETSAILQTVSSILTRR